MNIFATDRSAKASALALDDRRLVKMVLETAQIMSAALHRHGVTFDGQYRPTHVKHPCVLWAGDSRRNFGWLGEHGFWLHTDYTRRFGREHKSASVITSAVMAADDADWPAIALAPFANCTTYKDREVHEAYQQYMRDKWAADGDKARWTGRNAPAWR